MSKKEVISEELQQLLQCCKSVRSDLNLIVIGLRRRQLCGGMQCARATIEVVRSLLVKFTFNSPDHLMLILKCVGRELLAAAPSELVIGNLLRRVMFFVREEHTAITKAAARAAEAAATAGAVADAGSSVNGEIVNDQQERRPRGGSDLHKGMFKQHFIGAVVDGVGSLSIIDERNNSSSSSSGGGGGDSNGTSPPMGAAPIGGKSNKSASLEELCMTDTSISSSGNSTATAGFSQALKMAIIGAVNELSNEVDNYVTVCQKAQDYIHAEECILVYGYSKTVEMFLKAAANKRKFQLIIAEDAPSLDGHKLALALSKSGSIAITLIPDSNIYAIMSRVNKVIISPQAVMADGGAICSSGHMLVSVAAKEFSVPVVGVAGAFTLTPLFAHNQSAVLGQSLSPASAIPFCQDINMSNVEVNCPTFDYLPPNMIDLYVTNDGSQLPSYVFRQLSEYYHPQDYVL